MRYNEAMLPENDPKVEFLKQVFLFNEFDEDGLAQVAARLNSEFVQAGEVIFSEGDHWDNVYFVNSGEVRVTRKGEEGEETFLAIFDSGDTFGEGGPLFKRKRSATITAISDANLYSLNEADFDWVRSTYPQITPYLVAFTRTHETVRKLNIDWLNEEETISLAARRHPIRLIVEVVVILFLVVLTTLLSTLLITFLSNVRLITLLTLGVTGTVTLLGLVGIAWAILEWRNDYFFITNLRVMWRERILLRSASRQEVPLRTIQSLKVETPNVLARMIDVGDLVIKTFNSQMRLTDVNHPAQMNTMVDSFLSKAKKRSIRAEHAAIRRTIRHKFGREGELQPRDPDSVPLAVQAQKRRWTLFKTRMVEDDTITYRKHWWIFFLQAWKSSLAFLITILLCFGLSIPVFNFLGPIGVLMLYFIPFVPFLWWLYQYEDWRNDIYRITKDKIVDRDKKPFGKESFRSAPIDNIQSVGHEIPNTIGLIINVGNVHINVGDETLTFDGVHDPALVHQDISRRMEALVVQTERQRISEEHERMATWLDIYYQETRGESNTGPTEHIPDFD